MREVRFPEILTELIFSRGRKRKELADALHISSGAVSQYTGGRNKPSFDVLLALAEQFGVSLDYLVYGTESLSSSDPPDALLRYFDRALTRSQHLSLQRAATVVDVGRALADNIDAAVGRVVSAGAGVMGGTMPDEDTLELEGFANSVDLASMDLTYDVAVAEDGRAEHGRFLSVVANNLSKGRTYRVLLPPKRDWSPIVSAFRGLLAEQSSGDVVSSHLRIRVARSPLFAGIGIYHLDTETLEAQSPTLWLKLRPFVNRDAKLAYIISPSSVLLADCLLDASSVVETSAAFDAHWVMGESI
jgi:transcriptional regulator with XRE-family HTH domain